MKSMKKTLGLLFCMSLLSACSSLFENDAPPERIYLLKPMLVDTMLVDKMLVDNPVSNKNTLPSISLSVTAAPGLDTNKILILQPDAHLNHYASARWTDNSTDVFSSLLRNTLESSGRYSRVIRGVTPMLIDQTLELEIRELFTLNDRNNMASTVDMSMQGYLNCSDQEHPITLKASERVASNKLSAIVAAYQMLVNTVSQQLLDRTFEYCGS